MTDREAREAMAATLFEAGWERVGEGEWEPRPGSAQSWSHPDFPGETWTLVAAYREQRRRDEG